MRVNTTVLIAAIALFSSQCLVTATENTEGLKSFSKYFEEQGATLTDNSSSSSSSNAVIDVLQDDSDANVIPNSSKHAFDKTSGSAVSDDDDIKKSFNDFSEKDLDKEDSIYNTFKPNESPKPWIPTPSDFDINDSINARKEDSVDNSAASGHDSGFSVSAAPVSKQSKHYAQPELDVADDDKANFDTIMKGINGDKVDDSSNSFSTSASNESSCSDSRDDEPKVLDKFSDDMITGGSNDDDTYTATKGKTKFGIKNPLDDDSDKEQLDDILKELSTSESNDQSDSGSFSTEPSMIKEDPSSSDDFSWMKSSLYNNESPVAKGPKQSYVETFSGSSPNAGSDEDKFDIEFPLADSDSSDSNSESCSDSKSTSTDSTTTAAEEKPCHVSWWRKLAFWNSVHKCSELRRLRTDLD
ncbi:hypothetical protein Plhal304r1_c077g0164201 [Plasmopara halstedii]